MFLHVVGTQVEIQYTTAVRVHVRLCTYQVHIVSYDALQQQTATAVVVLQLLDLLLLALRYIQHDIDSSVLLLLNLNFIH